MKKYREYIYGACVLVIVISFYLLIMRHDSSGPFWAVREVQQNLKIWVFTTSTLIILMLLIGFFTRNRR